MHGQQVLHVQVGAQLQCRLHGAYIAHDHGRIFAVAFVEQFHRQILRADRQMLDLR
ncbi:hypothetical protein AALA26_08560 [Bifidobacterium pseudolongum]|uniref:hypothetical protein n=1 Tax=Bifidobacterium pseudolongum TaxID=1694 RepID=UPI00191C2FE8|nr:hypothetical protein [Bifidobacterium pseudolongum]